MRPDKTRGESNRTFELLVSAGPVPIKIEVDICEGSVAVRRSAIQSQRLLRILPGLWDRLLRRQRIRQHVIIRQPSIGGCVIGIQLNGLLKIIFWTGERFL